MSKCPHDNTVHCPLNVASHVSGGLGCDDGHLDTGQCAVARGRDYRAQVERIRVALPGIVEDCAWREDAARRSDQRRRNLRAAGLH